MRLLFFIAFIFILIASCGRDKKSDLVMDHADSVMQLGTDSAKKALRELDNLASRKSEMTEAQLMRLELLRTDAMNKGYVTLTDDKAMKDVVKYYAEHGSPNEQMRANYLLGCVYRDQGDALHSLLSYDRAADCADTASDDCDNWLLSRVYGQKGDLLLFNLRMPRLALEAWDKSIKAAWEAKDTITALKSFCHKACAYESLCQYKNAISITDSVCRLYRKYGYDALYAQSLSADFESLIETGQLAKSKRKMEIYERESGYFDGEKTPDIGYETYYYIKGLYYLRCKSDSAETYFRKCFSKSASSVDTIMGMLGLAKYYDQKCQVDSMRKYYEASNNSYDHLLTTHIMPSHEKLLVSYEKTADRDRQIAEMLRSQSIAKTIIFILIISLIVTGWLLYRNKVKGKIKLRETQIDSLKNAYIEKSKEWEQLEDELVKAKTENSDSLEIIAYLKDKMQGLQKELDVLSDDKDNDISSEASKDLINSRATVTRLRIIASEGHTPTETQWEQIWNVVNHYFPAFQERFKEKLQIGSTEIRACLLIWLGFSTSELKVLLGQSASNISNIRKRLSVKLFEEPMNPKMFDKRIREMRF